MAGWVSSYTGSNSIGNPTDLYGPSHSVSPDGSSWVFVSPDPAVAARSGRPSQLYLGREGLSSVLLSTKVGESEPVASSVGVSRAGARAGASSGDAASYAMRSKDGRFIVFTTADSLTEAAPEDASQKTYRYDMDQQTLTYLPDLTFTAAFSTLGPVLSMSDDGSRILYYNWDTGVLGLWRDNATAVVLAMTDLSYVKKIDSRFSKDGRTLVLTSEAPLRAQSDHPAGQVEIYRYTESDDALACISCPPESVTPRGLAVFSSNGFAATSNSAGSLYAVEPTRGMSDDGKRVFFHTTSPLVGADHNAAADVYEWREGSGLRMLSSGRAGATNAYIVDNDATGDNVFFVTGDGLVPQDTDGLYDLYDARVDGGFPEPQPSLSCSGEGCRGSASSPPSADAPQSSTLRSRTTASKRATARTETLSLKRATANVGGIRVKVVTAGPGRLKAQGRGLQTTSRTVKRAATYTLKLGLRQQARQTLKDKGWLKVRVRVRFQPDGGKAATQTVQLTIKTNRKGR